jgi:hypothetical protein
MHRLVVACGLLVIEAATHAAYAGMHSRIGLCSIVLPALIGASPGAYRAANEWFRILTEGSGNTLDPTAS